MTDSKAASEFYQSLDMLQSKMLNVNSSIENKKNCLQKTMKIMTERVELVSLKIPKDGNSELAKACENIIDNFKSSLNSWSINFENILEKEKFRDEFKDSFLVIIYGKVKAGKSSFGNYIAKHSLPTQKPAFFLYDKAGENRKEIPKLEELEDEDTFEVKRTEATSEIQGFRLSGLTWIDTPGLASMTKVNGNLAKEYIESADFIIYPVSSDAPGRNTDINEIKELFIKNKKVHIIITKSDRTKKAIKDGKIVSILSNKTAEDRKKQEEYVLGELLSKIPKDKQKYLDQNIFSLSTYSAEESIKLKDINLYQDSNMDLFYKRMTKLLNNEAINLKVNAPHNKLKTFVENQIIGKNSVEDSTLFGIQKSLKKINSQRIETLDKLEEVLQNFTGDILQEVEFEVDKAYLKLNKNNIDSILKNIFKKIEKNFQEKMFKEISGVLSDFDTSLIDVEIELDTKRYEIHDKYETIHYNDAEKKGKYGKAAVGGAGGILAAWAISNFWNPSGWMAAGALLVEMAAVAAASYVGDKIGHGFGEDKEEKVKIGDNKDKVINKLKKELTKTLEKRIKETKEILDLAYLKPISSFSNDTSRIINKTENELKGCIA